MQVIQKLVTMLNADRIIQIVASERDETVLADIVHLIEFEEFGPAVRVTPNERAILLSGQIPTVGNSWALPLCAGTGTKE